MTKQVELKRTVDTYVLEKALRRNVVHLVKMRFSNCRKTGTNTHLETILIPLNGASVRYRCHRRGK